MKKIKLQIPEPMLLGNSYKFWRSEVEAEKARLRSLAMGREPPLFVKPEVDHLVNAADVAKEFAISSRTLARRIKEIASRDAAA